MQELRGGGEGRGTAANSVRRAMNMWVNSSCTPYPQPTHPPLVCLTEYPLQPHPQPSTPSAGHSVAASRTTSRGVALLETGQDLAPFRLTTDGPRAQSYTSPEPVSRVVVRGGSLFPSLSATQYYTILGTWHSRLPRCCSGDIGTFT